VALVLWVLAACTKTSPDGSRTSPTAVCTKEGQNCEFAPGKIGLYTAKPDGCENAPCLTCVSLHRPG
jgi:hypothetical protein